MDPAYNKGMENAYTLIFQANKDMIGLWLKYTFLSWQWWFGVCLTIIPWILWGAFRKKEREYEQIIICRFFCYANLFLA